MKFSQALQFNAAPEWRQHYLNYPHLKKVLYQIERDIILRPPGSIVPEEVVEEEEGLALLQPSERAVSAFLPHLDAEVKRVSKFYIGLEEDAILEQRDLENEVAELVATNSDLILTNNPAFFAGASSGLPDELASPTEPLVRFAETERPSPLHSYPKTRSFRKRKNSLSYSMVSVNSIDNPTDEVTKLRKRCVDFYIRINEIKGYVQLNYTGFLKILKKFDKITRNSLKRSYVNDVLMNSQPFTEVTRERLKDFQLKAEDLHLKVTGEDNPEANRNELKRNLREQIRFDRNTVWRDMISMERKVAAVALEDDGDDDDEALTKKSSKKRTKSAFVLLICLASLFVLLNIGALGFGTENRCLSLLIFVSLLWGTEVFPLFVTSLMVPMLVVLMGVLRDGDQKQLPAPAAAKRIFSAMFSPVVMLLLGGFTIAAALSKHDVARMMASRVLANAAENSKKLLLACIFVATFLSMWISNVAAPVLCYSLIQPILRTLPRKSPYARCLILGIALASNVGGMVSPIASPQNLIAMSIMKPTPSWGEWFLLAIPLAVVIDLMLWLLLLRQYPSEQPLLLPKLHVSDDPVNSNQAYVMGISLLTVGLWCFEHRLHEYCGDMGIIAILPIVAFFGTHILTKEDFNNFLWTVVWLAMGGIALGEAVNSSGLLLLLARQIESAVTGYSLWVVAMVFVGVMMVIATFISHTVAAVILLPVIDEVGRLLPDPRPRVLVTLAVCMCSAAMGLPVSGFPNMTAIMMEDSTGSPYLKTSDFLRNGVPATVLAAVVILTMGYGLAVIIY